MNNDSQTPWTVRLGKLGNDEWAADVVFSDVSDATWGSIKELAEKYARFNFRACPPVSASDNDHRLRFRLGHAMEKPRSADGLSSVECETLRNNLVGCCEGLYKNGLGLWHLDRQLIWKVDGFFTFVPVFWLPAIPDAATVVPTMATECSEGALTEPSQKTDIYAIAAFCYKALTGQEHDPTLSVLPGDVDPQLQTWDAILDPALRSNPARRPDSFQDWLQCRPNQVSVPDGTPHAPLTVPPQKTAVPPVENSEMVSPSVLRRSYRRWVTAAVLLFAVLYLARTYMPGLMRKIPVINLAAPSYQRGTGSYVVRYADRSYDRATWKMVWSTENINDKHIRGLNTISGWDKNNFAISMQSYDEFFVSQKDGHWVVHDTKDLRGGSKPHYLNSESFAIVLGLDYEAKKARVYHKSGYYEYPVDGSSYAAGGNFRIHQPENRLVYITDSSQYEQIVYEYKDRKFNKLRKDEKRCSIWRPNNTNTNESIVYIDKVHSYKNGQAIGYNRNNGILKYEEGIWYTYLDTTHSKRVWCLWTMDERNFLLTGEGITLFSEGIESHPMVSVSGWAFTGRWLAGWGVSMSKYWVLDEKGNVAQFENEQFRGVVRGPELPEDITFHNAWVSPEGVVYAITKKEVYRLD